MVCIVFVFAHFLFCFLSFQEEVIKESLMMVPDTVKRYQMAYNELKDILVRPLSTSYADEIFLNYCDCTVHRSIVCKSVFLICESFAENLELFSILFNLERKEFFPSGFSSLNCNGYPQSFNYS